MTVEDVRAMPSFDDEKKLLDLIADLDRFSREKRFASGLNIFEAAGMQRQEIRHSNFLAFLLSPQETHGLGDAFLKRLIQRALHSCSIEPPPISALTVALADFSDALVSREWRNIDLLVESQNNKFVFVIENKIAINLKTAAALGLELPPSVLAMADEVIE